MPRQETITIYKFDELGARAKERARDWYRRASEGDEWWESVYEDARNVGLEIKSFDLERRQIDLSLVKPHYEVSNLITREHGVGTDTWKSAVRYTKVGHRDEDQRRRRFEKDLANDYLNLLQKELDYQSSDECVDESILANDYEFYASGERCTEFNG